VFYLFMACSVCTFIKVGRELCFLIVNCKMQKKSEQKLDKSMKMQV
jgi:hypothetical protein